MDVFSKLKTIKGRVEHLLSNYPILRDDDAMLIATFHYNEIGKAKMGSITAMELLTMFSKKQVTDASSIDRVRRSLQSDNENLRGKNYDLRHREEKKVRSQIRQL